jgi:hypothetical protein
MTRRCFLHVGSPKTGTSYLQNVLWRSREELAAQGVVLPLRRADHFFLTLVLRDEYDAAADPPRAADVLERLDAALARTDGDVLITHELLSVVAPEQIDAFLARLTAFEVHVVVTTRSLDRQLPSEWQQFVKTRHTGTYAGFLDDVRTNPDHRFWAGQDFAAIAAKWGATLPPAQVHVVTLPPSGAPPDELLRRFCSVLGVDASRLDADVERDNASIGYEQAELLRRVNETLGPRLRTQRAAYAKTVKFFYAEQVLAAQSGQRLVLPASERDWCSAAARDQADRIAAAGYDVVGDVEELLPVWPADEPPALHADDALLLQVALEATAALLVQRRADVETVRGLRQDLRRARRRDRPVPATAVTGRLRRLAARVRPRRS